MPSCVLDTSALLALRYDEAGADRVETLLREATRRKHECFASFMTYMEYFYCVWRKEGKGSALKAYLELKMLPVIRVGEEEGLGLLAGEIKASYPLSVADSWIAATALRKNVPLVHKDPEFEPLSGRLTLLPLPYKVSA